MIAPEMTVSDDSLSGTVPFPPLLLKTKEYSTGIHSGYSVASVPLVKILSMNASSTVISDGNNDPEPSFHPAISYPVLENEASGRVIVVPITMSFSGLGVVPWVFSALNVILYCIAVHFG